MNYKKKIVGLLFILTVLSVILNGTAFAGEIAPDLADRLDSMSSEDTVRILIKMSEQPMVSTAMDPEMAYRTMIDTAERTQDTVLDYLKGLNKDKVKTYKSFWLSNLIFTEVKKELITEIKDLPGVGRISEDFKITIDVEKKASSNSTPSWDNIGFVNAPEAWDTGYRGQGVRVVILDTGVDITHPELQTAMGGNAPNYEGYWIEFDSDGNPVSGSQPHDTDGHGTHTSGTSVGRNVNYQIGMAPEATLAHGLVIPGGSGTFVQVIS